MLLFFAVTIHFVNEKWQLVSRVLQTRHLPTSHTAEHLAESLQQAFVEWGIDDKYITGNTDNAQNIIKAWSLLNRLDIGCVAHILNLAVKKALGVPAASKVVAAAKRLVSHFHYSTTSSQKLLEKQKLLKLPENKLLQDVETRWNSTYDMICRILEQQLAIAAVLIEGTDSMKALSLEQKEIKLLEELKDILEPLKDITVKLSGESYATISIILPTMFKLIHTHSAIAEKDSAFKIALKNALRENLKIRYQKPEVKLFLQKAACLDPRFRHLGFLDQVEKEDVYTSLKSDMSNCLGSTQNEIVRPVPPMRVKEEPNSETGTQNNEQVLPMADLPPLPTMGPMPDSPSLPTMGNVKNEPLENVPSASQEEPATKKPKHDFFDLNDVICLGVEEEEISVLEKINKEFDSYLKFKVPLEHLQNPSFKPLLWWKENGLFFPTLAKMVKKILCVPATSTPSERVFSAAGHLISKKRAMLKPENVDMMLFLHCNYQKLHGKN